MTKIYSKENIIIKPYHVAVVNINQKNIQKLNPDTNNTLMFVGKDDKKKIFIDGCFDVANPLSKIYVANILQQEKKIKTNELLGIANILENTSIVKGNKFLFKTKSTKFATNIKDQEKNFKYLKHVLKIYIKVI